MRAPIVLPLPYFLHLLRPPQDLILMLAQMQDLVIRTTLTNVTTPTFTGTVSPSTGTVYLYAEKDGGSPSIVVSVTTASDGSYTISPTSALTSGDYVFYVRIENAAGDTSGNSPPLSVTVQTTPQAPVIPTLKAETDLGISSSDNITSDNTPPITGTVSPNTQVKLYVDGTPG